MALRMNATFLKVLLGLLIMESNVKRGDRIRRRRTGTLKRIPARSGFTHLRCHNAVYSKEREGERERERKRTHHNRNKGIERKRKTCAWKMQEHCDVQNLNCIMGKTQSKPTSTHFNNQTHIYNAWNIVAMQWEYNAWAYNIKSTTPNPTISQKKSQKPPKPKKHECM